MENILIFQDLIKHYNRVNTSSRCLTKIDLRKAYDSINWEFIREILDGYGFPRRFSAWVMECVCSTSFSICCNGTLHGFFKGKKEIRQGDPISPLIFVLVMEYSSRILKKVGMLPDFTFHPQCKELELNHLASTKLMKSQ